MTKRIRPYIQSVSTLGAAALVMQVFISQGCGGGSNSPTLPGSGGATGSGGSITGTGGSSTGSGGGTGTGGVSGAAGSGAFGQPVCSGTVVKGGACTAASQQFCYKTCGPASTGVKSETCQTSGTYAEMSGCTFDPTKDYSCYKIPTVANAACPAGVTPMGSADCGTVPECTLCNSTGGLTGGSYLDSTGAPKAGWCTCQAPNSAGLRRWTCASDTAWPCPLGAGC